MKNLKDLILKLIVEEYIENPKPIGSVYLLNKYNLNISSATIRNEMAKLEKDFFISKSHTSSGRIPTEKAYEYYFKNIINLEPDELFQQRIKDIFSKRRVNIDLVIDETISIISEITNLTIITSEKEEQNGETLKSITLTPILNNEAVVVLITSSGKIDARKIKFNDQKINLNDLKITVRLFQERLIDIELNKINSYIKNLEPLLRNQIKNYEIIIETFVNNVFNDYKNLAKNKVYGKNNIINSIDIEREKLIKILDLIENQSIWETIEDNCKLDENLKLEFINNDNLTLISKRLKINGKQKDISIVGPQRMDYLKAKNVLNFIDLFLQNEENNKKK